ncbi:DUF4340 domain-containing protein [Gracilibacillus oryzae]|uniref:DUF4340 domain-containing protein n=1 Tax=Gracilibacillus oryzae TaxID=1672701 RepID=A0A7C8KPE2_9BACI|nr:DUF4340 domain-containing protein [Gracilibacillus oryzae]KAB8130994.1 DUF4340 domain-containing protein [Gracilibacillus oryzae]
MKKKRYIFLLLFVISGLAFSLFILSNQSQPTDAKEEKETVIDNFEEIGSITVRANENVELMQNQDGWKLKHADREQNDEKIAQFIETMKNLEGKETTIAKKTVNLDFPKVTVVFENDNGSIQQVSIGQMSPAQNEYYVHHKEKDRIYLVDRAAVETIPLKPGTLLDSNIISIKPEQVNEIFIDNGTEKIELTQDSPFSVEEAMAHISGWYVKEPFHSMYSVKYSRMEAILTGLKNLKKVDIVEDNSLLGEVDFRITFRTDNHSETLLIGNPAANQHYYAKLEGTEEVFTIETRELDPFSVPSFDLIDHFVHILPLQAVNGLKVESSTFNWTITSHTKGEKETSVYTVNNKEIPTDVLREAYKGLAGLSFDKKAEGMQEYGERELTITYMTENDNESSDKIDFYSIDDQYFVFQKNNEGIDFIIEKAKVYQALEGINQILPE